MAYDLILKNGRVVDPGQGIDGVFDVAFANGKVAALESSITADAADIRDVSGLYVFPGLIDLHTHVYWGGTFLGVDASMLAARSGMTTAVDAGSAGAANIRGLLDQCAPMTPVRILAFINLAVTGIFVDEGRIVMGEAEDLRLLDIKHCVDAANRHRSSVVGVKIRVGASTTKHLGAMPLHMAIRAGELADLPVMVHIGAGMPPRIEDIVDPLRKGDVLTHFCTPKINSPMTREGFLRDCMIAARERGVVMDVGHGAGSFGFGVARRMLELGFAPDVISSDVHAGCVDGPAQDVLAIMSKYVALGLPINDVVRAATTAPAAVCRRPDLGSLAPQSAGDAAVVELRHERTVFRDSIGDTLAGDRRFVARGVVIGGRWWRDAEPRGEAA
ncbi:MAG: dihydroorotase [Rhizobiales bacterium 65-9]|nr:MAG: dihydroorotase [Rhizobiales bacterium 65-9]